MREIQEFPADIALEVRRCGSTVVIDFGTDLRLELSECVAAKLMHGLQALAPLTKQLRDSIERKTGHRTEYQ